MSNWEQTKLPCPCGKSSDAYCINVEGDGHCFSCGEHFFKRKEPMTILSGEGVVSDFYPQRGISLGTLEFYDVLTKFKDDEPKQTGYVYPNGAVKIRNLESKSKADRFFTVGPMSDATLFGMNRYDPGSRESITITEGEVDALSIAQVTNFSTAACSVRNAAVARGDCTRAYEYINSFKKIYLCFDNDEAGISAMKSVSSLFDFKKVYIVRLNKHKDANEYLKNGDDQELFKAWRGAKRYTPDNIISSFNDIEKSLEESKEDMIATYPFKALNDNLWGLFRGEVIVFKGAEGIGKQLPNNTLIPCINGFKPLSDIVVGDIIFGADGKVTEVTYITDTQYDVPCYEIEFSDGTKQVSGGPHRWGVYNTNNKYEIRTTKEIFDSGVLRGDGISLYSVPITKAVEYGTKNLPINPYDLGVWLGDGHSYSSEIYVGYDDQEQFESIHKDITHKVKDRSCVNYRLSSITHKNLNDLGVLRNKHIPESYLFSSIEDRRELLKGLMDTDGSVTGVGCEFYTSNKRLLEDFLILTRGLGYKCRYRIKTGKKSSYTVWFLAHGKEEIFKYERKQNKVVYCKTYRATRKTIRNVKKVESVPSRCLQVDNNDHLFLCGDHYTVTHNTEIFRALEHHILKSTKSPIGILHLEEDNGTTVKAIATYELEQPVIIPDSVISNAEVLNAYKKAVNEDDSRVYIHSSFDVEDEEEFVNNIRFLVSGCGVEIIFLDHISWLATGGDNEDERKKLDRISQKLKLLAKELRFCLVMISHTNDDGKTRGSRNITKVANTVIHMHRDTTAADINERRRTYLTIEKARLGGRTGPIGYVVFDTMTYTLKDVPDAPLSE